MATPRLAAVLGALAVLAAGCSAGGGSAAIEQPATGSPAAPASTGSPSGSLSGSPSGSASGSPSGSASGSPSGPASGSAPPAAGAVVTAVGDVIMGAAPALPPADGRHLFDGVRGQLRGDVVLANLDQALTDSTVGSKCTADSTDCFALRTPPSYAGRLREAGITVANMANNHSRDFGEQGLRDTRAALETAGVATTGLPGQVTVQRAGPLRVAVLGFAPYGWTQSLLDLGAAQELVRQAGTRADVVLVTIHAGGEGADRTHVRPGTETFLGEDRGDPMAFSRAVIDAGADAVLGAGPHVLRGMEWYRGRLIAYSLGNFVGPEVLNTRGPGGVSAVLTIELAPDGGWRGGRLTPIRLVAGLPRVDPDGRGLDAVRELSREDLGTCAVEVGADGTLGGPAC